MSESEIDITTLENEIRDIVATIIEVGPEEVTPKADFVEDLGMDSMMALEVMASIEKKYKVRIPEEYLGKITNLTALLQISNEIINGK